MRQNTNSGRYQCGAFPLWRALDDDDVRTTRIKAAKNIISIMAQLKEIDERAIEAREMHSYHKAIKILKEEGEKYP